MCKERLLKKQKVVETKEEKLKELNDAFEVA